MSLFHFVQWRGLLADGGGFRACFFEACRSKEMARGMVEKKPEAVRPEVDFNPIQRVFFHHASCHFLRATSLEKTCSKSTSVSEKPSPLNIMGKTHVGQVERERFWANSRKLGNYKE